MATELGDETAVGAERAVDSGECSLLAGEAADPVKGCVGEDGIELISVRESGGVVMFDVEVALAGGGEHGGGGVDAQDVGSGGG